MSSRRAQLERLTKRGLLLVVNGAPIDAVANVHGVTENCLCVLRAHSSLAQAKFSFPVADCQSRAFGSF